jgi:hypothetical protein
MPHQLRPVLQMEIIMKAPAAHGPQQAQAQYLQNCNGRL